MSPEICFTLFAYEQTICHVNACLLSAFCLPVKEDVGSVLLPVVRGVGSRGRVSAQFMSRGLTATPDLDYILQNGSVTFDHRQNTSYINVTIIDDLDR